MMDPFEFEEKLLELGYEESEYRNDLDQYENLYYIEGESSAKHYTTLDMMQEILSNYGLDNPSDPYSLGISLDD